MKIYYKRTVSFESLHMLFIISCTEYVLFESGLYLTKISVTFMSQKHHIIGKQLHKSNMMYIISILKIK